MSTQANSNVKSICISAPNQPNGALLVGFFCVCESTLGYVWGRDSQLRIQIIFRRAKV